MKKVLLFILILIVVFFVIFLFLSKSKSEIKESVTDLNGVSIFKDKNTREKVEILVKNRLGENLKNIHIGYIDGKGFEFFQFEDPLGKYMPAMEIYPHHSIHSVTMSLPDEGPLIEEYVANDTETLQAIDKFSNWMFGNSKIIDHGMMSLEEWSDKTDTKIVVSFLIPHVGNKLKIIGTVREIIGVIDTNGLNSDLKNKYHLYSYLPFDGITNRIYLIKEVADNAIENDEFGEIGEYVELNYDFSELYFPLQVSNHWKYELKKYSYSAEQPDDIVNFWDSAIIEINIDRKEVKGDKECFVMMEESDEKYFYNECGIVSILDCKDNNNTGDDILLAYEKTLKANGGEVRYPIVYLTTYTNSGTKESVNVKAGKFINALKVESKFSNNEIDLILTEWFAENVGVIKGKLETEYKIGVPRSNVIEWELLSYNINKEDNILADGLTANKETGNIIQSENAVAVFIGKKLIAYGSGKVISFAAQKIAEKMIQEGTEKTVEETSKKGNGSVLKVS